MAPGIIAATAIATALLVLAVVGSQSVKPDENTLQQRAQTAIGEPVSQVSNVRSGGQSTYFNAHTKSGVYKCEMLSGGMVAFASMGMPMMPHCSLNGNPKPFGQ